MNAKACLRFSGCNTLHTFLKRISFTFWRTNHQWELLHLLEGPPKMTIEVIKKLTSFFLHVIRVITWLLLTGIHHVKTIKDTICSLLLHCHKRSTRTALRNIYLRTCFVNMLLWCCAGLLHVILLCAILLPYWFVRAVLPCAVLLWSLQKNFVGN